MVYKIMASPSGHLREQVRGDDLSLRIGQITRTAPGLSSDPARTLGHAVTPAHLSNTH